MERIEKGKKNLISFVIPYYHSEERLPLLTACLRTLPNPYLNDNIEICIMEVGEKPYLEDYYFPYEVEYGFMEYNDVFHRAWVINAGVKYLSNGETLVLLDGDLLLTSEWYNELLENTDKTYIGWGKLFCLNEIATNHYLDYGVIYPKYENSKIPSKIMGNGGITIISREIFYYIKGIPENFKGTWGGEDNALFLKIKKMGFPRGFFKSTIYHLYHSKSTPRVHHIIKKIKDIKEWKKRDWRTEMRNIGDTWGEIIDN